MIKNIFNGFTTSLALITSACVFAQSANAGFFSPYKPATEESIRNLPEGIYQNLEPKKIDVGYSAQDQITMIYREKCVRTPTGGTCFKVPYVASAQLGRVITCGTANQRNLPCGTATSRFTEAGKCEIEWSLEMEPDLWVSSRFRYAGKC